MHTNIHQYSDRFHTGCLNLLKICADIQNNDTVLIITNKSTSSIGEYLCKILSCNYKILSAVINIQEIEMHGNEPSIPIDILKRKFSVILALSKKSIAHTDFCINSINKGTKFLSLPDYSESLIERQALHFDFRSLTAQSHYLAQLFSNANEIILKSNLGTNMRFNIKGRKGNSAPGWCWRKGIIASPPDAEVNIAVVEPFSEGVLVIDGSIPHEKLGLLNSTLTLQFKNGKIIHIEGENKLLIEKIFNSIDNENAKMIGEFGVGLNPDAVLCGFMLEDEGCLGTVHIGIGSNILLGGKNDVPFHLDCIIKNATVLIDDINIINNGVLTLNEKEYK